MDINKHQDSAAQLRSQILTGKLRPGQKLPGERQLCQILGISRITVRHALNILAEEKLIYRRHGSGTYVSDRPKASIPLGIDYGGSISEHAPELKRRVLKAGWILGRDGEAEHFPPESQLLEAVRVDTVKRKAIAWDKCFIPEEFAEHLQEKDLEEVDFIHRWTGVQKFRVKYFTQKVAATAAGEQDHALLGLKQGSPVLCTIENYYSDQSLLAGTFISHYHPEKITLHTRFNWDRRKTRRL